MRIESSECPKHGQLGRRPKWRMETEQQEEQVEERNFQMETYMRVNGGEVSQTDMEYTAGPTVADMKENGEKG